MITHSTPKDVFFSYMPLFNCGPDPAYFLFVFRPFHNAMTNIKIRKAQRFEPWTAGLQEQTNPLNYGGRQPRGFLVASTQVASLGRLHRLPITFCSNCSKLIPILLQSELLAMRSLKRHFITSHTFVEVNKEFSRQLHCVLCHISNACFIFCYYRMPNS